jgi:hypothetical protein
MRREKEKSTGRRVRDTPTRLQSKEGKKKRKMNKK